MLAEIESALDSALRALIIHRNAMPTKPSRPIIYGNCIEESELPPRTISHFQDVAEDPIGASLKRTIEDIGYQLDVLGGLEQMNKTMEIVAGLDSAHYEKRIEICNRRWDRVGDWHA